MDDYYKTPGKNVYENAEKGMMNNLRSVLGEMVGRGAFLINNWFPEYGPAQKILEENKAGTYAEMADSYFDEARAEAGEYGDRLIDFAENFSEEAGYNLFGPAAGDVFKSIDIGLKEYEKLIGEGVPKEQALLISAKKGGFSFVEEKLLVYGSKWSGDHIPKGNTWLDRIYWDNGPVDNPEIYDTITPIWLNKKEYGHVMHELATNITEEEKLGKYVWRPIGDFVYYFRKNDNGYYEIVDRIPIK